MAQKEFKKSNFAKLFNYMYIVFFGNYLQYISWAVKNSKTVDMLLYMYTSKYLQGNLLDRDGDLPHRGQDNHIWKAEISN